MTKLELRRKILKVLKVFNGREEAIFDICWKEIAELKRQRNNCEEQFQNKVEEVGIEIEKRLLAEERCKKLEKENAELKKKIGIYQKGMYDEIEKRDKKLTKAIGIIKRWYETNSSACVEPSQELIEVTEQFLKEIEK